MNGHTHEFEPTFGFPESLPASEKVLWQGSPCAWLIARRIFFLPHLFFYFLTLSFLAIIFNSEVLTLKDLFVKFLSYMSLGMVAIFILLSKYFFEARWARSADNDFDSYYHGL